MKKIIIFIINFLEKINLYNHYDINQDGIVDVKDLLELQNYILKKDGDNNGKH